MTTWLNRLGRRLRLLLNRDAVERSMDDELQYHLECEIAERIRGGERPEEARRRARVDFGSVEGVKERARDARGGRALEDLVQDLRFGARVLTRHRWYSLAAALTFALGIGAVTAIYSLVYGVLLRPLPYAQPDRLVVVWERSVPRNREQNVVAFDTYEKWRGEATSFSGMAAVIPTTATWTGGAEAELLRGADLTHGYFGVLGVAPALGRDFTAEDAQHGAAVILSDRLWRRLFNADAAVIGKPVSLSGRSFTVVGVMPTGFDPPRIGWLGQQDLWFPLRASSQVRSWGRAFIVVARLRDDVHLSEARAEMTAVAARHEAASPASRGWSASVVSLGEQIAGDVSMSLAVLMAAATLLWILAVANVSTLSLSLIGRRTQELSVRRAIGATDRRLFRQLFTQSILLGTLGAIGGAALAFPGVDLLIALLPPNVPRARSVAMDLPVLMVTTGLAIAATITVGTVAAIRGRRLAGTSPFGVPSGARVAPRAGGGVLVIVEIALAVALGVMAVLMGRSYAGLSGVDLGFRPEGVVVARVALPATVYASPERQRQFFDELAARIQSLDGVVRAGVMSGRPFGGVGPATTVHDAAVPPGPPGQDPGVDVRFADAGVFAALGIRFEAGTTFDGRDAGAEPPRVVISASLARQLWPSGDAVGRRLALNMYDGITPVVAGVVNDIHLMDARTPPRPAAYLAVSRFPSTTRDLVLRIDGTPEQIVPSIRTAVSSIDAAVPVYDFRALPALVDDALAADRLTMYLLSAFSAVALALAGVGVFGVFAGDVTARRKEIGIRLALGAVDGTIVRLLLAATLRRAAIGLGAGVVVALSLGRAMESLLFGVSATDPMSYAGVLALVTTLAVGATLLPAWQALRASPLRALREE